MPSLPSRSDLLLMLGPGEGGGAAGDLGKGRPPEVDGDGSAGSLVELGQFGGGGGEADAQAFGFPPPALAFGLGDPGEQVVADLLQVWPRYPGSTRRSGQRTPR